MRTKVIIISAAFLFAALLSCDPPQEEGFHLTFKVDMNDVDLAESDAIGIRGSIAPLSWTETYPIEGPGEEGIYTVTVPFKDAEYGTPLEYKYTINDSIWDNDSYGEYGNRLASICCNNQILPVDKWNQHEGYDDKRLLESASWDTFMSWIFTLSKAKERGLSMEEVAQENVDFWGWEPDENAKPEVFLYMDEFFQAKSPSGHFEVLEHSPEKVEYIKNKDWEIMLYQWNEKGVVKGVTAEEMTAMFRKMKEIYVSRNDWTLNWQDLDDHKVRIMISK